MRSKFSGFVSALVVLWLLSACQSTSRTSQVREKEDSLVHLSSSCIAPLANATADTIISNSYKGWNECFDHNAKGLLADVIARISIELKKEQSDNIKLDNWLYYLRAFSYYGDIAGVDEETWQLMDKVLTQLTKTPNFYQNSDFALRLQEHYLVSIYRYYDQQVLAENFSTHLPNIIRLYIKSHLSGQKSELSLQGNYTLIEHYRALGFLFYRARSNDVLKKAISDEFPNLSQTLIDSVDLWSAQDWQLDHNLWVLANLHVLLKEEQQKLLDEEVKLAVFTSEKLSEELAKQHFSQTYLANSFRFLDNCQQEFKGSCTIPELNDVLPINHQCSKSLFIRATTMTLQQLNSSCERLLGQEKFFHRSLKTKQTPVANDFNQSLRVVIFDNYSDYNRYGQLVFNIGTNNGGMYIEGTPSKPGNQATFYSFQKFWQQSDFEVWNLNHEYVHYLDGRFVKYSGFGHFPSHVVWWSEGVAEYISKADINPKAFALLNTTKEDKWPTLEQIFATTYEDGSDRVYRWSYLAHLYIFQTQPSYATQLVKYLKTDYFKGYQEVLNDISSKHQDGFKQWLIEQKPNTVINPSIKLKNKIAPMYRYLYRDYLLTPKLPVNKRHQHFFNVG